MENKDFIGKFKENEILFFNAISDYLYKGVRPKNDEFIIKESPELLQFAGVSQREIVIKTSVINKAREHSLTNLEIEAALHRIADPVLIFDSDNKSSENKKNSILALTDAYTFQDKLAGREPTPIAFSMNLDSDYERGRKIITVNEIRTIHDRKLIAKNGTNIIQKWVNEGLCRYVDDKKISDWQLAAGVQFPLAVLQTDNNTILTKSDFVKGNLQTKEQLATNIVLEKLQKAGINVITDEAAMQAILDAGKNVQKMAAHYGTNQNIESAESFNGYGVYVLSVNEENARNLGLKIASKKYGNTFYINNQPLSEFLQEKNFSSYWQSLIGRTNNPSVENLLREIISADSKGNAALEKEQSQLATLCNLNLISYKREQTYLYSVEIPDNTGDNYLFYDRTIGKSHADKINAELEKIDSSWKVSRNDTGKSVYFNLLSEKVFATQKQASEFLQKAGYVGMETQDANYIIFDDREMNINNRVQYMTTESGEVYGFVYNGQIYADKELMNSNVLAHEYTHIWDNYTRKTNEELWERGKTAFKQTSLWNDVLNDPSYQNIRNDEDEILSECHARVCGKIAQAVLEKIAERDGEAARNAVIDWDREVSDYIANELLIKPELGTENYVSESIKAEVLNEFLSMPMKDLMNGVALNQESSQTQKMEQSIDDDFDKSVEQMQSNSGMSEAAMEAEMAALENQRPDYLDEKGNPHWFDEDEEDYDDGFIPLEVVARSQMQAFDNPDKTLFKEYVIRVDEGTFNELLPKEYSNIPLEENVIPCIVCRKTAESGELQFFLSKYENSNLSEDEIINRAGMLQTREVKITDAELLRQISSVVDKYENEHSREEMKRNNIASSQENGTEFFESEIDQAAALLKGMKMDSENYKELVGVINKIKSLNGQEAVTVPTEKEIAEKITSAKEAEVKTEAEAPTETSLKEESQEQKLEDEKPAKNNKIVYGETVLPTFTVLADGKLKQISNAVVTGYDKNSACYTIESSGEKMTLPKETFNTLMAEKQDRELEPLKLDKGRTIVFEDEARGVKGTVLPEFSMVGQGGLKVYKGCVVKSYNPADNSYTLSNGDDTIVVTAKDFAEISSEERFNKNFGENSKAYEKLLQTQYEDYFKQRDNTAANFKHNLSVYCRKEANSPCDAMRLAKIIVDKMSDEERTKTERLFNAIALPNETPNEVIARIYHDAVKEVPLNEDYVKSNFPDKIIARPLYDTVSGDGQKIADDAALVRGGVDRNLKIGDTLKNVDIQSDKLFGGGKNSVHYAELKVVSASKEGNAITLMDSNKSYFKLPLDTVLERHKEMALKEMRLEKKRGHSTSLGYA